MRVLIVEDDNDFRETLELEFKELGWEVFLLKEVSEIRNLSQDIDFAILDLRLKTGSGIDFIPELKNKFPKIRITMLTAYGSIATCIQAIKLGASNYLLKPCRFKEIFKSFHEDIVQANSPVLVSDEIDNDDDMYNLYNKEREYIEYVLKENEGNISKTAKVLGIRRQSLQRKLKKFTHAK